ncbi:MAG TPA: MFS transporter [Patescibacteria group bacterium]
MFGKNAFKGLTFSTFLLMFASFFADIATEMLYPILPIFITQTLLAPTSIVGIVEGIAVATQNIIQGFSGYFSDKLEKHKAIAVLGYCIAAISKPLIGFSVIWQQVLAARFSDRLGTGIRSAPRDSLIAQSADEKHRGKAFGLEGIGDNLGAFIGPLIAVLLLYSFHTNIRTIFYLAFIPAMFAVITISLVKEKKVKIESKTKLDFHLSHFPRSYWNYLLVTALFGIGNSSNAFLILRAKQAGISLETTIIIYAFFNLVAAFISYPAGALSDKIGRKTLLFFAFLIFLATYLGFGMSTNFWLLGFLFILYGIFSGTYRTIGKTYATDFVPQSLRASAVGFYATTVGLTGLIASIVGGFLWTSINSSSTFYYGAFFAVVSIFSLLMLNPQKNR